ncbi:rutC family protein UK114 [Lutzomyia longipalpis]|uniref:Translation initiation inhibitor n=1 Tax=Lutzomyia longipalpis TaxID=7200 RepID=A0A1B0CMN8_LUTLO|nr:rutC family protein UK114 [Lutzomyia longipalpis]
MASLTRKIISTALAGKVSAPYSQAIVADRTVYVSGCLGLDKDTLKLVPGGIGPETAQALTNLQHVLAAANSGIDKVVKVTVFLGDIGDMPKFNEEYKKVFTHDFPARSCFAVANLPLNGKVEIEAIALTGDVKTIST